MKLFRNAGFAIAIICATLLLITAFILFFSYAGNSPDNENPPVKMQAIK